MIETISRLISSYGYAIVGVCIGLESAGLPIPGETALLIAAAYAGTGHLDIKMVILVAAAAAVIGDAIGYWIGRTAGRTIIRKYGHRFWINEEKLKRVEGFFQRHGPKTVFFGRFIGILRTYSAFFAGVSEMPYPKFTLFNATGGILWATIFGLLGYAFGRNLDGIERMARLIGWSALLVVLLILTWQPISKFFSRYERQIAWLRRRLEPGEYLGLHFLIGLLIAGVSLWLFTDLTEDVVTRNPIVELDFRIVENIQNLSTPITTAIMVIFTTLGSFPAIGICLTAVVVYRWRRQPYIVGGWLITLIGGELLNLLLKELIHRPRPPMFVYHAIGFSFPSGHAMVSLIAYGYFTYLQCLNRSWTARTAWMCACVTLVLFIGFSRIYLGVHYFSDVVAGYAAGAVWLSTCITATELLRKRKIQGATKIMRALK